MRKLLTCLLPVLLTLLFTSTAFAAHPLEDFKTPAEESGWERTTTSQEVIDYCLELVQNSGGRIRMEYLTWTIKGRLLPLLVIGHPAPAEPGQVPSDKAVMLVNCNIHSGEVEGKESMLIFAREAAMGKHDDLLKDLVILLCPNMNPDGNDDLGTWRRNTQFSPKLMGTRYNGQGHNINRDMTKLEAYEGRAMVALMNKWDPVIFVDAHATNGSFMRHAVTYNWGLHPNTDPDIMQYNRDEFSRKAIGSESYLYKTLGHISIPYGNFGQNYSGVVDEGWWTFEDYPRYTTNYSGLRNRLGMLLEVYSYDPFPKRVETQYACIYGIMQTVAAEKDKIKSLIKQADDRLLNRAKNGLGTNDIVCLDSKMEMLTEVDGGYVNVLSYAVDADGKVSAERFDYDEDGFRTQVHFTAEATHHIPYYGKFVPSGTHPMGALYVIRPGSDILTRGGGVEDALQNLLRHGVEVYRTTTEYNLTDFEWFAIERMNVNPALYEGHYMNRISGSWEKSSDVTIPTGSYVVSTSQKNGNLAALLLEPESVDGLASWNFFDKVIYSEGTRYDRFATTDPDTRRTVVCPVFKLGSYSAIPTTFLEKVERVFQDQPLPPAVSDSSGSSGCATASFFAAALFTTSVIALKKTKR